MSQGRPIAVTGLGAVSAVGDNVGALLDSMWRGRCGIRPPSSFEPGDAPALPVAEVETLPGSPEQGTRTHRLAIAAAREAFLDAAADGSVHPGRIAAVVGTTTGGIEGSEAWYLGLLENGAAAAAALRRHALGTVGTAVAQAVGAKGPCLTLCTACSSGANAIEVGADLLRSGQADLVVAGGADGLCRMTYLGFTSLQLLASRACRPFDRGRDGLSLGEAGAMLVLERLDDAVHRGRAPQALLLGGACTCDAHHPTTPAPDGDRMVSAVERALARAGLRSEDVDYVNAHGTGTRANDAVEGLVLRRVFSSMPPVSCSKSFLGHTMGAAGAIEAVITILALREGLLPPTLGTLDPEADAPRDLVLGEARRADVNSALSTSFGFGGNNAVLAFGRAS